MINENYKSGSAIEDLVTRFKILQREASSCREISDWLKNNASLLRNVSSELDHAATDLDDYLGPAEIYDLRMPEIDQIGISHDTISYCDSWSQYNQVESYVTYDTDSTINLPLIFSRIPELGIQCDYVDSYDWFRTASGAHFVFSPKYWTIAAASLLYHLIDTDPADLAQMQMICTELYPGVNLEVFNTLCKAGLFTGAVSVRDWMISQCENSVLASPSLPVNVL